MNQGMSLLVYPVKDVAKAKILYRELLGIEPYADGAYYVGFRTGNLGPIGYWEVTDIRATLQQLLDAGAQVDQDVRDVGGGKLIATVKDADGNTLGLMQSP
jgi:catechol 2,3-dioxygenase-like lactoylglutathione lyase family enzyme